MCVDTSDLRSQFSILLVLFKFDFILKYLSFQMTICPAMCVIVVLVRLVSQPNISKRNVTLAAPFVIHVFQAYMLWNITKNPWIIGLKMKETPTRAIPAAKTVTMTNKQQRHLLRKMTSPRNPRKWKGCCRCFFIFEIS